EIRREEGFDLRGWRQPDRQRSGRRRLRGRADPAYGVAYRVRANECRRCGEPGGGPRCALRRTPARRARRRRCMNFTPVPELLEELRNGRMVVVVDDEDRENEGDLVMAAELVKPSDVNFMVTHARGLVCLSLTRERCAQLGLAPMVQANTAQFH